MKNTLISLALGALSLSSYSQDLLRYVDAESTVIQSDWRLKQPKVSGSGYDYFSMVNDGSPLQPALISDAYRGTHSIAYEVNTSTIKERIEHKFANINDADATLFDVGRYYGFAIKMDPSKWDDFSSSLIFFQAWQGYPYNPPVSLKFMTQKNSNGDYRVKLAIRNDDTGPINGTEADAGSTYLSKGVWHAVQVYLKPSYANANGQITVWIDGTKTMDYTGKIGYTPDPPVDDADTDFKYNGVVCKWGIYQPDPNTGHRLLFDEIKYGNTLSAVLPSAETTTSIEKVEQLAYSKIAGGILFNESIQHLELIDINGHCILKQENTQMINTSNIPKGIYILKVNNLSHKIIL